MFADLHSRAAENEAAEVRAGLRDAADDPRADPEFRILVDGCGLYPLDARAKVVVTGEDRTRWLNGMVTNNVRDLAPDHGLYAFLLNAQGRIQGDLYAFHRGDRIVLDVDRAQARRLIGLFDHYIVMDDVVIEDVTNQWEAIGVQGPNARATLRASDIAAPELAPLELTSLTWQGAELTLVRAEAWKGEAYEIWAAPEQAAAVFEALQQAGAERVGAAAQRLYRMAAGIPLFGEDIRERDLPQETGQERALHFAKGCYVGQEIVERIRSRGQVHRVFSGFELTAPCAAGDKIAAEGKEVGEITSTANFSGPEETRRIGLGYLRREAFGKALTIHGAALRRRELPLQELFEH
jgi:folate-binding protein YgfZ